MGHHLVRALGTAAVSVLLAVAALVPAVGRTDVRGLWTEDFSPRQSQADCQRWRLDENAFCHANDSRNGLEVGVKFRTSTDLSITGIRIYRTDPARVRASLWDSDGTLLARGVFDDSDGHGWQDMSFAEPVHVVAGRTYVASYFTPGTKYAFEHGYFRDAGRTVGPVTALRSVAGDPNGVHCYDDDSECGSFPSRGWRDSSYFVTPLWSTSDIGSGSPPTSAPTSGPTGGSTPTDPSSTPPAVVPTAAPDTTAPRVTSYRPDGTDRVGVGTTVTAVLSERVRPGSLTRSTVRLVRAGTTEPVRVRLRYDEKRSVVVIDPRSPLRPRTSYVVVVTSGVRDRVGNQLDQASSRNGLQSATWRFTTR